jgi:membrane protein YqaA with SNARE-associated domain
MTEDATKTPRKSVVRRLYDWVLSWADTPYGSPALGVLSFAESSFFPIPPDPLLIALSVAKPRRAFVYAAICSVSSVLGGMAGYALGYFVWLKVKDFFFSYVFSPELFNKVGGIYQEYDFVAVFAAGFTPIPYKVFTVGAGVFELSFVAFVVASLVGRSARFFLVAGVIWKFGPVVREKLEANFDLFAILFLVLLVAGFVVIKLVI